MVRGTVRTVMALVAVAATSALPAQAQSWERVSVGCENGWRGGDDVRHCETRVATVAAVSSIVVDAGQNGGVSVTGWSRNEIEVRAEVRAWARDEGDAQEIAREVRVYVDGGRIGAEGPDRGSRYNWSVSYEIMVPVDTDLDLETQNGGISIESVNGDIRFDAVNGGVHLTDLSGDVRGETTNGGLHVELDGERWRGEGLNARTTNGGVTLYVPDGYSAELTTGTVNGGLSLGFPVMVQGKIGRRLTTTLGGGGAPISVTTTNGGVRIERGSAVLRR